MTATINASTTAGVVITPDNSGNIQLQYNGVAAPAFSATISADQTVSTGVWTKMQFNTEQFDTNNNFDSSTNYRFTPTVAGYYQINLVTTGGTTAQYQSLQTAIYKNGSVYQSANSYLSGAYIWGSVASPAVVMYFNGSTDYVEGYIFVVGAGTLSASSNGCRFSGYLARSA